MVASVSARPTSDETDSACTGCAAKTIPASSAGSARPPSTIRAAGMKRPTTTVCMPTLKRWYARGAISACAYVRRYESTVTGRNERCDDSDFIGTPQKSLSSRPESACCGLTSGFIRIASLSSYTISPSRLLR